MADRRAWRTLPLALLLVAATACAETEPDVQGETTGSTALELPVKAPPIPDEPPPRRMPGSDETLNECNPDAARGAIGQEATADVVEQARVAAGANVVRTLKPGQVITMEYHASRLNLSVDDANVVVDVSCG